MNKIFTTFEQFVNEGYEPINEAFKSSKLSSIANLANGGNSFFKAVAGFTKVKLDQITDDQVVEMTPVEAYKTKAHPNALFFYISDNEKQNPYADSNAWSRNVPGNTLLAIANGRNEMFSVSWEKSWATKDSSKTLKNVGRYGEGHGVDKRHSGYGASGLSNIKRLSEVSDRVLMFDPSILPSAADQRAERSAAKSGAVAFMSDKEFKAENLKRYKSILANRALNDDIDKMVEGAIGELAGQIQKATKEMKLGKYGDLIIGLNSKGSEAKLRDASNHMSRILDNYSRYADYINKSKSDEETSGGYYKREAASYAKEIKTDVAKIKNLDYAW